MNNESHTYFYHNDHLGSTRLVTDESKNIVVAATYEPFGESSVKEGEEVYLFNGKEKDSTGLYYYGARYYDPETGRFLTRDPLGGSFIYPQTLNRYAYCANNPLKYVDPTGLWCEPVDEEVQQLRSGGSGSTGSGGGSSSGSGGGTGSGSTPPTPDVDSQTIDLGDGKKLTTSSGDSSQSGNVLVGYGLVTDTSTGVPVLSIVFFVILFDEDGNVENYETWDPKDLNFDKDQKEKYEEIAEKMVKLVGTENLQDLSNALFDLQKKMTEKADINPLADVAKGAAVGAVAGALLGGLGSVAGGIAGGIIGGLSSLSEKHKWQERQNFLSYLLIYAGKAGIL